MKSQLGCSTLVLFLSLLVFPGISAGSHGEESDSDLAPHHDKTNLLKVLYTGRLIGYFRIPSWQPGDSIAQGCAEWTNRPQSWSKEAQDFDERRRAEPNGVLVGTGDNFAPEIEARDFWPPPVPLPANNNDGNPKDGKERVNASVPVARDQYFWYPELTEPDLDGKKQVIKNRWIRSDEAEKLKNLQSTLENGWGMIPTDNVGCFLIQEGYAAVVPGRHDFYFGPERLREIARFLASNQAPGKKPVQMLGANLVIETTWKSDHKPLPDSEYKLGFMPNWPSKFRVVPTGSPSKNDCSLECDFPKLISPKADGKVYPWLSGAILKLAGLNHEQSRRFEHRRFGTANDLYGFLGDLLPDETDQKKLRATIDFITKKQIYLCQSTDPRNPNAIPEPKRCDRLLGTAEEKQVDQCRKSNHAGSEPDQCPQDLWLHAYFMIADDAIEYVVPFPDLPESYFKDYFPTRSFPSKPEQPLFTLKPGENYGLCLTEANQLEVQHGLPGGEYYCQRFSVNWPFFSFHQNKSPLQNLSRFSEPEPYVFLPADPSKGRPVDVAIFGIVDPTISEYIGLLNLAWANNKKEYNTSVVINDPIESLREISGYFEQRYWQWNHWRDFKGTKILLGDMSAARAKALAAHFREFQIVVSGADEDLETAGQEETVTRRRNAAPKAFIAVPADYYRTSTPEKPAIEIGKITLSTAGDQLILESGRLGKRIDGPQQIRVFPGWFNDKLQQTAHRFLGLPNKNSKGQTSTSTKSEEPPLDMSTMQSLTLYAMQQELGSDVALLQTRDFFDHWVDKSCPNPDPNPDPEGRDPCKNPALVQLFLDRIIWKGDFLALVYVPGSALLKALEQSKKYESDDSSALSLSDEHDRTLVQLGIVKDKEKNEYLINEAPIDKNRLYAVATSDYIAAGGTGYPDFSAAIVVPPQTPQDFPKKLQSVSSIVCRRMSNASEAKYCQNPIPRKQYLDSLNMEPTDRRKGETLVHEFWALGPFHHSQTLPKVSDTLVAYSQGADQAAGTGPQPRKSASHSSPSDEELAQQRVHFRGLGAARFNPPDSSPFVIDNASFSFTSVTHKFSDAELKNVFPGSPLTQLTAARSHTLQFDVRPRYTYSRHWGEFFQMGELRFNGQYTGQANASRLVNQKEDVLSSDTGFAGHLWARGLPPDGKKHYRFGRNVPHFEPVFTLHYETQVLDPLPNFLESLATSSKVQVAPGFEQSRTHLLLGRTGGRYLWRAGWAEGGLERGKEFNAIRLSTPAGSAQTRVLRPDIPVSGAYFNGHLIAPISKTISWQIDEMGDYFFNQRTDNPIDPQFRSDIEMALNIKIWPSLSLSPTYEIFAYTNKVQQIWFWQGQASLKLRLRFDFWNHRDWWARQIRYSPSAN